MCFKNLPVEFDEAGRAYLKGGIPDPYSVTTTRPEVEMTDEEREAHIHRLMARNGHIRELNMDPVTRVAGALAVNVTADLENGRYLNAHSQGTLFRGYEVIAMGRDPRDAVFITSRACGVCGGVHSHASVYAIEMAMDLAPPPLATVIRNMGEAAEMGYDNPLHLYLLAGPDYSEAVIKGVNPELWPKAERWKCPHEENHSFKTMSELKPLNLDQAIALVRQRLDGVSELAQLRKRHEPPLWPLRAEDIQGVIPKGGCVARALITHCRDLYERARGASVSIEGTGDFLERIWAERYERQMKEGTATNADGILHTALPEAIRLSGAAWRPADPPVRDVEIGLVSSGNRLYVSLCNHGNMTSLAGRLRRLRDAVGPRLPASSLVLVRHPTLPLPKTAKRTQEYLDDLCRQGARFLQPSEEAFAALAVLREMLAEAEAGDLHCRGETLSPETAQRWLREHISPELRQLVDNLLGATEPAPDPDVGLHQALMESIEARAIATLATLAEELGESEPRLVHCVRRFPEHFRLLEGAPPVVYRYVPEEVSARRSSWPG
jgi:hypothetical protein